MNRSVSVVLPVAPRDVAWTSLLPQLELPIGSEIILAIGDGRSVNTDYETVKGVRVHICTKGQGRAGQMNAAAHQATHPILWFLHADSQLTSDTIPAMLKAANSLHEALYFFDLKFLNDGPLAMKLNEWAVFYRSAWMKMPFGDQGFLIQKDLFEKLGGYREDLAYGEDHDFVWKVRQKGYRVERIAAPLFTSARKYQQHGWLRTTLLHLWLTFRQAFPRWLELVRKRFQRRHSSTRR